MAKQKGDEEGDYRRPQSKPKPKSESFDEGSSPFADSKPPPKTSKSSSGTKAKGGGSRSSGGGSRPAGRPQQSQRTVFNQLRQQFPFDISRYVEETIRLGESSDYLYARILQSPEFKASFPGIFRPNGTLRYSPGEYMDLQDKFTSLSAKYGIGLSRAQLAGLISQGKTPDDFELDAKGIQMFKMNPDFVKRLNEQIQDRNADLIRQGKAPIKGLTNLEDAKNFFTGRAPQEVYDLYEAAQFATAAGELAKEGVLAGFSNKAARALAAQTAGVLDIDDIRKGFQNVAQSLRQAQVDLAEFGLSDDDLLTVEFGGKDQGALALRASQALRQAQARAQAQQAGSFIDYQSAGGRPTVLERQEASL